MAKQEPKELTEEERRARIEKALGYPVSYNDFNQTVFEKYQVDIIRNNNEAFYSLTDGSGRGVEATAVQRGGTVRAAIAHGILTGITQEQCAALKPYVVRWLADEIKLHVLKVVEGPTDPN